MTETYLFDAYAILEIMQGNPKYAPYTGSKILTTQLHLFEITFACLRYLGPESAGAVLEKYKAHAVAYDEKVIAAAAWMRYRLKERRLSMADMIGYTVAASLKIPFLTGDRQFSGLPNVEFVR